jgi:hypothetical protein
MNAPFATRTLYQYQQRAATFFYERDAGFLIAPLGAGKGAAALTALAELIRDGERRHALVIAPKLVATTVWPLEVTLWPHLAHLRVAVLNGTPVRRRELLAGAPAREVTAIGVDLVPWLVGELTALADDHPLLDVLIIDETSRLKDPSGKRARALLKVAGRFRTRWGLTGTPRPNSSQDLFMPAAIITDGALWGRAFIPWQRQHFRLRNPVTDEWVALPGAEAKIAASFGTVAMTVGDEDMPDLPPLNIIETPITLPDEVMASYRTMARELFTTAEGRTIEAASPLIATGKLAQIANGFVYGAGNDDAVFVHDLKIEWLRELVESLDGEPLLIAYEFIEDLRTIRRAFADVPTLSDATPKEAAQLIAAWNAGALPLLAFHPACLSSDTEVLTEHRRWVRIVDARIEERVFDGVEYVSHGGCAYSGFKPVIEVFGLTMTPDHKLLVNGQWEVAANVRDRKDAREAARYEGRAGHVCSLGSLPAMRRNEGSTRTERDAIQQVEACPLRGLHPASLPSYDRHPAIQDLEKYARTLRKSAVAELAELWRAWNSHVPSLVEKLYGVLARHGAVLFGRPDHRAYQREWPLFARQLSLGVEHGAASEQAKQSRGQLPGRNDAPCRIRSQSRVFKDHAYDAAEPRDDRRCGSRERAQLHLRQGPERETRAHVYDLVACGPRHQFLIRNADGEAFISHNSAGHGLNLQHGGWRMAWLSPSWSAELTEQAIARIYRPGQTRHVTIHVCIAMRTVDEMKRNRVLGKMSAQEAFKLHLKQI